MFENMITAILYNPLAVLGLLCILAMVFIFLATLPGIRRHRQAMDKIKLLEPDLFREDQP